MMDFEGKNKLLVGEVELSAFSVHGNATVKKRSEVWLEFKKDTPTPKGEGDKMREEIIVGKPVNDDTVSWDVIDKTDSESQSSDLAPFDESNNQLTMLATFGTKPVKENKTVNL